MSRDFIGDSNSPNPQRVEEDVHADIGSLILNQPLDLAIEHLQTFLRTSRHEKLTLERGSSYGGFNKAGKISLRGVRSETDAEIAARLAQQRSYIVSSRDNTLKEISDLEGKIASLRKQVERKEQKLKDFSTM